MTRTNLLMEIGGWLASIAILSGIGVVIGLFYFGLVSGWMVMGDDPVAWFVRALIAIVGALATGIIILLVGLILRARAERAEARNG